MFLRAAVGNAVLATLLALFAAGAGCLLGKRPALRHALWLLVLLKLVTPPLSLVPMAWIALPAVDDQRVPAEPLETDVLGALDLATTADTQIAPDAVVELLEPPPAPAARLSWREIAAMVWLAGTGLIVAVTLVRVGRWNRLLVLVRPAPDAMQARIQDLAGRMGLSRCPRLDWFHGTAAPMLWGLGRQARVIVPIELWNGLSEGQRTMLLIHELAHFRRRDHWVRLLELVATAFYWWLPVVWIARRALHEAEEQCCDAWVVSVCPKDTRSYAETLLQTVDFLSESAPALPLAASGFGHVHHLKRRVIMIMRGTTPRSLNLPGALGILGLAAMLLPLSPTWAQNQDATPSADKLATTPAADTPEARGAEDLRKLKADADAKLRNLNQVLKDLKQMKDAKKVSDSKQALQDGLLQRARAVLADDQDDDAKLELLKGKIAGSDLVDEELDVKVAEGEDRRAADLAKARAEVDRARHQLDLAEKRLAVLQGGGKNTATARRYTVVRPKKPAVSSDVKPTLPKDLFRRSLEDRAPARDQRIAEIELTLQKLLDEVKMLKGEREKPR